MKSVKEGANARAVLASYHPLWLRLGVEVVVGAQVAGVRQSRVSRCAQPAASCFLRAVLLQAANHCINGRQVALPPPRACSSLAAAPGDDERACAADLAAFVRDRFLKDPQLAKQHPPSSKAHWTALARLLVKRFLLLAALLDRVAALPSLPAGAPLLFRPDARLKSSAQALTDFLTPRVAGEGDVARTLGRLGYKLSYVQDPRAELNFAGRSRRAGQSQSICQSGSCCPMCVCCNVNKLCLKVLPSATFPHRPLPCPLSALAVNNLATDLRDGLRLVKLAALLTGQPRLLDSTRYPSDRRPVRVANLQLALDSLARAGMSLQGLRSARAGAAAGAASASTAVVSAAELVDGDREMTLHLLWRLILHFQLPQVGHSGAQLAVRFAWMGPSWMGRQQYCMETAARCKGCVAGQAENLGHCTSPARPCGSSSACLR